MVVVFSGGGTGGHLYPALSIASALTALRPDVEPHFVGARRGIESRILPERGLPHTLVEVEGLERGRVFRNVGVLRRLFRAVAALVREFKELAPAAVVLTGGYASAPAGLAGVLLGLPIVLQEQNETPGLTTRLMSRWARQIHLAYPEARAKLSAATRPQALDTGNPIRPPVAVDPRDARASFHLPEEGPVVLAVGGSQGSAALNGLLVDIVAKGLVDPPLALLWATGPPHYGGVLEHLEGCETARVRIVPYIDEMPVALSVATLAISRAGAMTTSEVLAWGIPSVLVPLPTAAADHQSRNAEALEEAGVAVHLPETGLDAATLWRTVTDLIASPERLEAMRSRAAERGRPDAAREIASAIAGLLPDAEGADP